jgi:hypothetical protein
MIVIDKNTFVSLNALANHFNLPDSYLKQLANRSLIPFLKVNGRLRFNFEAVQQALSELAAKGGGDE